MPWCPRYGTARAAGCRRARTRPNPPARPKNEPYKTHLAYVKERRSDAEAAQILDEALEGLRARVGRGEIYL